MDNNEEYEIGDNEAWVAICTRAILGVIAVVMVLCGSSLYANYQRNQQEYVMKVTKAADEPRGYYNVYTMNCVGSILPRPCETKEDK